MVSMACLKNCFEMKWWTLKNRTPSTQLPSHLFSTGGGEWHICVMLPQHCCYHSTELQNGGELQRPLVISVAATTVQAVSSEHTRDRTRNGLNTCLTPCPQSLPFLLPPLASLKFCPPTQQGLCPPVRSLIQHQCLPSWPPPRSFWLNCGFQDTSGNQRDREKVELYGPALKTNIYLDLFFF